MSALEVNEDPAHFMIWIQQVKYISLIFSQKVVFNYV